ncbi:MAG TPA: PSD1 and planctomycete cytochrome C domain-containing protein [Planctomycetota bacterium]|nr:PSD1 and planctomycete cytochrome C domain-containing protein [Planctomycetota bacterium]
MRSAALLVLLALPVPRAAGAQEDRDGLDLFERKIRPVLVARCQKCHSLEAEKVKGGLLVDTREGLLKGGNSGPALVPGSPERSLLIKAIRGTDDDMKMPPKGEMLAGHEVADFEAWIRRGAPDPRKKDPRVAADRAALDVARARTFWSFQPLAVDVGGRTSIDSLVDAALEEKGLVPTAPADKRTLLRRATHDLTGLPPSPEEIDAFLADDSADAFEKVVERLLASPRYGERWGRHWLDLVRYADTAGDSSDFPVPQAVRYRDYVIRAFNEDKPYDRFLREQVAGDLLPHSSDAERRDHLVATGYLALARRFGIKPESFHHLTIEDTIDNLGRTVLGLTLSCARCHDHKFDPIPTEDYYGLYGIFQSTRYPYPGSETTKYQKDFAPLAPAGEAEPALKAHRERLAGLEAEVRRLEGDKAALQKARKELEAFAMRPLPVETAFAVSDGAPRDATVHVKGDPDKPGAEVPRRFLQVLGGQALPPDHAGSGRLELAGWLTDPANPLTARVMVNRIWQHHFGRGLVATPSDFGKQGRRPTHPALLDFLAGRFMEAGWSVKAVHRMILLSAAWQRAGTGRPENAAVDPDNEFLWKFSRRRMEAEEIRDTMLLLSGDLDLSPPGPHPFPASPRWDYSQARPFTADYSAFEHRRRTVYWMSQRLKKRSFMEVFDGPDSSSSTPARPASTSPLQALFMMNDPFAHERANRFAARLIAARPDDARRIELAYLLALGRPPKEEERRECETYLRDFRGKLEEDRVPSEAHSQAAWASLSRIFFSSNEFMFLR